LWTPTCERALPADGSGRPAVVARRLAETILPGQVVLV
jgi:hypothetical protein